MMGYASGYNPVALTCHDIGSTDREGDNADNEIDADPLRSCHRDFDLDGAIIQTPDDPDAEEDDRNPKGNLINMLLTGGIHEEADTTVTPNIAAGNAMNTERANLIGRWITAPEIAAETTVMVTLPGAAYDDHPLEFAKDEDMFDPVSLLVFDEMGMSDSPMEIMLDMAVNTCTFMMADGGGTDIMCNGAMVGSMDSVSGGFRIYNSETVTYKTDVDTTTETDESEDVDNDGAEDADGDMKYMAAATLPAIGLVHSHYDVMGMDGMMGSYDHISSLLHTGEMN
jgi:hypothetical protein